ALENQQPGPVRQRIVQNLQQFLPGKWHAVASSTEFRQAIDRLLKNPSSCTEALALIAATGATAYVRPVKNLAVDPHRTIAVRRQAIATLGKIPAPESVAALKELLFTTSEVGAEVI